VRNIIQIRTIRFIIIEDDQIERSSVSW